jgi:imidazoleglycerol-phosphate dehydratase
MTTVVRNSRETCVEVELIDDLSRTAVQTSVPFLDHMLMTLSRYAAVGLRLHAHGDLRHHIVEDTAIALGTALRAHLPPAIARYGDRTIPMDDALVHCSIDLGVRAYYAGRLPSKSYDHWMRSFADNAGATLHLRVLRGHDRHHVVEAAFKALGLSLREAMTMNDGIFSTKGEVELQVRACR